jgi:tetratricopeptide (TPR) repeat protein
MKRVLQGLLIVAAAAALGQGRAYAQSADLVLCDRVAADPADPDKPADAKGVADIAASDIATAIKFCRSAANSSRRAMYQLGRAYAANRQTAEALAAWRKAADKGSSSAMVELGVLYGTGAGVARDEAQARKLFERAAQAGNPRGVSNLAALGGGASSDPARARELLSKGGRRQWRGQGRHCGPRTVREGGGAKSSRRAGADGRVRAGRPRWTEGFRRRQSLLPTCRSAWRRRRQEGVGAVALSLCDQGQARQRGDEFVLLRRPTITP